jgi:hypothetical protein
MPMPTNSTGKVYTVMPVLIRILSLQHLAPASSGLLASNSCEETEWPGREQSTPANLFQLVAAGDI